MEGDNVMSVTSGKMIIETDEPGNKQSEEEKEFTINANGIWGDYYIH